MYNGGSRVNKIIAKQNRQAMLTEDPKTSSAQFVKKCQNHGPLLTVSALGVRGSYAATPWTKSGVFARDQHASPEYLSAGRF